jgi:hypothetical protein
MTATEEKAQKWADDCIDMAYLIVKSNMDIGTFISLFKKEKGHSD